MGLYDKIKSDVKKSGTNKGKIVFIKEGTKGRYRFLQDLDDGIEITFHDSYEKGINVPCQEHFGRDCEYCADDDLRTRSLYCWSVYDYDAKEVKLFLFAVNNCSPVGSLAALYEEYGTLLDRDFVISVSGKAQNKTYSVVPMDKEKFRNSKAKPFTEAQILKIIDKAFPDENGNDDDDDEDEAPKKKPAGKKPAGKKPESKPSSKGKSKKDEDEDEEWEEDEDEIIDYSEMEPKELYTLCKERDIEVLPKKPAKYYIKLLEEYDDAQNDWTEEDEDDEWED